MKEDLYHTLMQAMEMSVKILVQISALILVQMPVLILVQMPGFLQLPGPYLRGEHFDDEGYGIAVDSDGNSYVTGSFKGTASFGTTSLTSKEGSDDIFIAKVDSKGTVLWATSAGE